VRYVLQETVALIRQAEQDAAPVFKRIDETALANHQRVLRAFHEVRVSEFHFRPSTGYGYDDPGREVLDRVWARAFGAEAALVRLQIVSGTHALAAALYGVCRPGDEILSLGRPYDTLARVIGIDEQVPGSLRDFGVGYREAPLSAPEIDVDLILSLVGPRTKILYLQRSQGYAWRPGLSIKMMGDLIGAVKKRFPEIVVVVDNCYGEFVEADEPPSVGADLTCGSLIKNPGGGLAPTGGYIAGRKDLVLLAAGRLTAPGLAGKVGCNPHGYRLLFQGLYLAPHFVAEALKGAVLAARLMEMLGYKVSPRFDDDRTDIVQAIRLGSPEKVLAFCRGIQRASPVDAHVVPEAGDLPGYSGGVVMAAGTFVQGASLEMTADAPLREPYAVYFQGGLSLAYTKIGLGFALRKLMEM
jgi:cystathionine beta-lyase family protein involved in aluminum resistance